MELFVSTQRHLLQRESSLNLLVRELQPCPRYAMEQRLGSHNHRSDVHKRCMAHCCDELRGYFQVHSRQFHQSHNVPFKNNTSPQCHAISTYNAKSTPFGVLNATVCLCQADCEYRGSFLTRFAISSTRSASNSVLYRY